MAWRGLTAFVAGDTAAKKADKTLSLPGAYIIVEEENAGEPHRRDWSNQDINKNRKWLIALDLERQEEVIGSDIARTQK